MPFRAGCSAPPPKPSFGCPVEGGSSPSRYAICSTLQILRGLPVLRLVPLQDRLFFLCRSSPWYFRTADQISPLRGSHGKHACESNLLLVKLTILVTKMMKIWPSRRYHCCGEAACIKRNETRDVGHCPVNARRPPPMPLQTSTTTTLSSPSM
jgi:hypothetical protein